MIFYVYFKRTFVIDKNAVRVFEIKIDEASENLLVIDFFTKSIIKYEKNVLMLLTPRQSLENARGILVNGFLDFK